MNKYEYYYRPQRKHYIFATSFTVVIILIFILTISIVSTATKVWNACQLILCAVIYSPVC